MLFQFFLHICLLIFWSGMNILFERITQKHKTTVGKKNAFSKLAALPQCQSLLKGNVISRWSPDARFDTSCERQIFVY